VRFPCLALAFRALEGDPALPIVLNAANEVAVAGFLDGRLAFPAIGELICRTMDAFEADGGRPVETLQDVRAVDSWARAFAERQTAGVH
jgi:1-deoxy-D-xylulose-5-phosphate reductoisomerase